MFLKGKHHTEKTKKRISETFIRRGINKGSKSANWRGGISKDFAKYIRKWRHRKGINKRYNRPSLGLKSLTRRERRLLYKYNKKQAGKLTIKTIQLVYEDNIKKYGTLTCYLCKKPIDMQLKFFNKITSEHLEHKTPLSRGGSNDYENLGIACSRCNIRKHDKTVAEYKKYLNNKGVKK